MKGTPRQRFVPGRRTITPQERNIMTRSPGVGSVGKSKISALGRRVLNCVRCFLTVLNWPESLCLTFGAVCVSSGWSRSPLASLRLLSLSALSVANKLFPTPHLFSRHSGRASCQASRAYRPIAVLAECQLSPSLAFIGEARVCNRLYSY